MKAFNKMNRNLKNMLTNIFSVEGMHKDIALNNKKYIFYLILIYYDSN